MYTVASQLPKLMLLVDYFRLKNGVRHGLLKVKMKLT